MKFPALALVCLAAVTATAPARADRIDDYVRREMQRRHLPGVSIAVVRNGEVTRAKGYGYANLELRVRASPQTVYEIGSITKQFTSAAVMLLVEEGKIRLDEKLRTYLPDLPAAWDAVTIRHLLTHTSGIHSYTELPTFGATMRQDFTQEQLIGLVSKLPLDFAPGEKWHYSNTGYYLLGMVVEKVSGKKWPDFLDERIFRPLGMTATRANDLEAVIPNRASGYRWDGIGYRVAPWISMTQPFAAGVLVSTVLDLAKWDAALYTERLLKPESLKQTWTPAKLNDGHSADYGFGWQVRTVSGHRIVEHGGGIPGFTTYIMRLPEDGLSVIVLTNTGTDPGSIAAHVAEMELPALREQAIADKEPEVTARLKALIGALAVGNADPELFTPEARAEIFPAGAEAAERDLKELGALKKLELLERHEEGERKVYRYRATFARLSGLKEVA